MIFSTQFEQENQDSFRALKHYRPFRYRIDANSDIYYLMARLVNLVRPSISPQSIMKGSNCPGGFLRHLKLLLLITTALLVGMGATAWAEPIEEGRTAFERGDYPTARRLWGPPAAAGDARAQYWLGVMYENGGGVPEDDAAAVQWYKLAAEQGDAHGQASLGYMYEHGKGVPQDYAEAIKWFRLAAAQGSLNGEIALGEAYRDGHGVALDDVLAYMWFNVANASSSPSNVASREWRDEIAKRMTPQQIADAQKLSRECLQQRFQNCD